MPQSQALANSNESNTEYSDFNSWFYTLVNHPFFIRFCQIFEMEDYKKFEEDVDFKNLIKLLNNSFLTKALEKIVVKNWQVEKALTYIRRYILLNCKKTELESLLPFLTALSVQCYFNEYVFYFEEDERQGIEKLLKNSEKIDVPTLLLIACYTPLDKTKSAEKFRKILSSEKQEDLKELAGLFFGNAEKEQAIKGTIPQFGKIRDDVSKAVQKQYEENPYPRWLSWGNAPAKARNQDLSAGKEILVAGCGTGLQTALASMVFPAANITAIDLSLDSLAYAKRKADEMGLKNINFLQGDLLDIKTLGKKFDYIICCGVLHHMKSPGEGLEALKSVLLPEGVLQLSLYSEIARRNIVAIKKWIKKEKFEPTPDGIRQFRKSFLAADHGQIFDKFTRNVVIPDDFFTVSECRDLFFHVHEHQFTCLGIRKMLQDHELGLMAFGSENQAFKKNYLEIFPEDPHAIDLENWDKLERQNPNMFLSMYLFYVFHEGAYDAGEIPEWLRT